MNSSPIRTLFIVPDLRIGGAERHLTTLAAKMNPARFTPSVICIGEEGELFGTLSEAGVEATALNLGGKKNALRALRQLVSRMRSERPDVVVMRGYNADVLGRIAGLIAGVPHRIVWVHGVDFGHERRSSVRNVLDRFLVRWTSSYFGVAEAQRSYLVDGLHCPSEKVRVIHNGVELALFDERPDRRLLAEFGVEAGAPVVAIVAALRLEKDHRTLLHAAHLLLNELPRVHIVIVGDGSIRNDLETLSAELGIASNVHFAGARSDIAQILRAIDVFTLSSVKETFPIAVLEAMACARPVVCTDVGGISEVVEDGVSGYLVPPQDPTQLAARLKELLSNPEVARRMGHAGRRRIEAEFSLERSVGATERAIEEIVYERN